MVTRIKGRIKRKKTSVPFSGEKNDRGVCIRIEFPGSPLEYSIDCPCLEPIELLGLLLPAVEERLGEIEGVFVEEVEDKKKTHSLKSLLRFLSKGG